MQKIMSEHCKDLAYEPTSHLSVDDDMTVNSSDDPSNQGVSIKLNEKKDGGRVGPTQHTIVDY